MDEICNELIPVMKKEYPRRAPTNENLYDYFLSRTRQNLHVVLCFSPVWKLFKLLLDHFFYIILFFTKNRSVRSSEAEL